RSDGMIDDRRIRCLFEPKLRPIGECTDDTNQLGFLEHLEDVSTLLMKRSAASNQLRQFRAMRMRMVGSPCAKCCLKLRAVTDLGQPEATYHARMAQAVLLLRPRPPALARPIGACRQRLSCQVSSDKTAEAGIEVVVGELHLEQSLTNWKRGQA